MTNKELKALAKHWQYPARVRNGNVELKKGNCWGVLCSVSDGRENAQILIERNKPNKS